MTRCFSRIFVLFCLCKVLALSGCGGNEYPKGFPKLYSATVTLTQQGTPLEGASVTFFPEDTNNQWGSGGKSDAQGKVHIITYGKYDGMPEGKYKVTVIKTYAENPPMTHDDPPATGVFSLVATKYNSQKTTDLAIEVKPSPDNHFEFDLGEPVKIKL
ncbi:MAG: carboxypeptidase-like regulatory domain-containing protein [Planctomycetaceae bacterium]|nr:carboxypeptidase-like regulatory domain-containing protein [Planctomycetaceae bacterium]